MQALRYYHAGKIEIEEIPCPQIHPGEVLVRVHGCGVCATDIKTYLRGHPKIKPGSILGHEISGVIAEVNQAPGWTPGMRVAVAPYVPCLKCDQCLKGNYTQCDVLMEAQIDPGGFAQYVRVPAPIVEQGMVALPDHLSLEAATLAEPLACCIHGLEALEITSRDSLLIIGDGPMGLLQADAARIMGVGQILLIGKTPNRLERARRVADVVIHAGESEAEQAVKEILPKGASKVMVSVGSAEVAQSAFRFVQKGGAINLFAGLPRDASLTVDPALIHYDEVRLIGTFGFAPSHFRQAVDWLAQKKIDPKGIITGVFPLADAKTAFQDVAEYRGVKSIITFPSKEKPM